MDTLSSTVRPTTSPRAMMRRATPLSKRPSSKTTSSPSRSLKRLRSPRKTAKRRVDSTLTTSQMMSTVLLSLSSVPRSVRVAVMTKRNPISVSLRSVASGLLGRSARFVSTRTVKRKQLPRRCPRPGSRLMFSRV